MVKATWNGVVIAESDKCEMVEGNYYFPPGSVKKSMLERSDTPYTCPWKGVCTYYNVRAGDKVNKDAAWSYHDPKPAAKNIKDHVAFWRGVKIEE